MSTTHRERPRTKSARGEYIETDNLNKISRRSKIEGTPHIILGGKVVVQADACLRGDLVRPAADASEVKGNSRTAISVGRYTVLGKGCTLHPPCRVFRGREGSGSEVKGELQYYPMKIGEHVFIGSGAFVSAASIGHHVYIGEGAVVGTGCVIKDGVKILEGSVMVAGMVAPSGVVVGGRPARILGEVDDGFGVGVAGDGIREGEEGVWVEGGELRELVRSIK